MISISEAKKHLNKLTSSNENTIITKNGSPVAAIVPYEEYVKFIRLQREKEDLEAIQRGNEYFAGKKEVMSQSEVDELLLEDDSVDHAQWIKDALLSGKGLDENWIPENNVFGDLKEKVSYRSMPVLNPYITGQFRAFWDDWAKFERWNKKTLGGIMYFENLANRKHFPKVKRFDDLY